MYLTSTFLTVPSLKVTFAIAVLSPGESVAKVTSTFASLGRASFPLPFVNSIRLRLSAASDKLSPCIKLIIGFATAWWFLVTSAVTVISSDCLPWLSVAFNLTV